MNRFIVAVAAALAVAGCSGNPFDETDDMEEETTTDPDGITGDRTLPPGTSSPAPDTSITRTEPTQAEGGGVGDGFVTAVDYDSASDTFVVDNLGFDGANTYTRGTDVSSLGPYGVYEAAAVVPDSVTGTPINQFTHRAIYGVSPSTNTRFAIVRTGSYIPYGFGGFVYQRDNGVTLPTGGQAIFTGEISGIRDFDGSGGLEYSRGDIDIAIDFEDFNDTTGVRGDAVRGVVYNRDIIDINGNVITADVIDAINTDANASLSAIPTMVFTVGPGVLDDNGEITGEVTSFFTTNTGTVQQYEQGMYYAVIAGDAEEIVGVIVTESTAGQPAGITVRDTGGFIVVR